MRKPWKIVFTEHADKDLSKIDKSERQKILKYLQGYLQFLPNPRASGKPLRGKLSKFWRYRVGDYRIVCSIEEEEISILVIRVAHRKKVYDLVIGQ